jgi:hypothetical protein
MEPKDVARQMDSDEELQKCTACGVGRTISGEDCTYSLCDRFNQHTADTLFFIMFRNAHDLFNREDWKDFAELMDYNARSYGVDPLDYHKYLDYFCKAMKQNGYSLTGGIYGPMAYIHANRDDIHGSVDYPIEQGSGTGDPSSSPPVFSVRMSNRSRSEPWVRFLGFNVDLNDPEWLTDLESGFRGHKPEKYLRSEELAERSAFDELG